jgi:hypothetical protein
VGPNGLKRFIRGEIATPHNTIQYVQYITYIGIQYGAILYFDPHHALSLPPSPHDTTPLTYVSLFHYTALYYSTVHYTITSHHITPHYTKHVRTYLQQILCVDLIFRHLPVPHHCEVLEFHHVRLLYPQALRDLSRSHRLLIRW